MEFKQAFLEDLVLTYEQAEEIRVYEDRVKQCVKKRFLSSVFDADMLLV
jgi:hypothetical protein